jgi:mannose/fructose/N-acetylgalactosamine-specific phosphotransferase system component IID
MKYIYSFLILIGGVAGLIGLFVLTLLLIDKIKELEHKFECKHKKYYLFKEKLNKVIPWVVGILITCVFLLALARGYLLILKVI